MVVVGIYGRGLLHIVGSGMGEWGNEDMRTEWLEFLPADLTRTHTHTQREIITSGISTVTEMK